MEEELLRIREEQKKKKPVFTRQDTHKWIWLKKNPKWRRPRGLHSKLRRSMRGKGVVPDPGYGAPRMVRGFHPTGYEDVLVTNMGDMSNLDPKKQAIRIASKIGMRKKTLILKKTEKMGLKVLNE